MKANVMEISGEEFFEILSKYLLETEGKIESCNIEWSSYGKKFSICYCKYENVNDTKVKVNVKLEKEDIINIFSKLIKDYDITDMFCNIINGNNDYFLDTFDGISLILKEKQQKMQLDK